jgi:hypothetical protein
VVGRRSELSRSCDDCLQVAALRIRQCRRTFPDPRRAGRPLRRALRRDLADLDFFVALGYWKLAIILEGVYARYAAAATARSTTASRRLPGWWSGWPRRRTRRSGGANSTGDGFFEFSALSRGEPFRTSLEGQSLVAGGAVSSFLKFGAFRLTQAGRALPGLDRLIAAVLPRGHGGGEIVAFSPSELRRTARGVGRGAGR